MADNKNVASMKVYRKKCTFKGATDSDYWYSATRSDGTSVNLKFKCAIPDEVVGDPVFFVSNIKGSVRYKDVDYKGTTYHNAIYYVVSCDFAPIPPEELEV